MKVLLSLMAVLAASSQQTDPREILESSTDHAALERTACMLARSRKPGDLELLGRFLRDRRFLSRLNGVSRVMAALGEHPTPQVVELCLALAEDPVFVAEGDRKSFALEVLAAVKPMSEQTAAVFQRSNEEGYFAFTARLLANNGSPRALALFEAMMLDRKTLADTRIECLHVGIVPHRLEAAMLGAAERIVARATERAIRNTVIESVFDFNVEWFGRESGIGKPRDWQFAPAESRRLALHLADTALARSDLDAGLRNAVSRAREALRNKPN